MNNSDASRLISNITPVRICDLGGWTDTWFAGQGNILNIAVEPYVNIQIEVFDTGERNAVILNMENYDEEIVMPDEDASEKHPLIAATIKRFYPQDAPRIRVSLFSAIPPGASTGTSAAVVTGLISALNQLSNQYLTAHEIAAYAHRIETEDLGLQSGIQDQLSVTYGGINYIEMQAYPKASISPLRMREQFHHEINNRLILIYLGKSHVSSEVHHQIIESIEAQNKTETFAKLRQCAIDGRAALLQEDLDHFGRMMIDNTNAQMELHNSLVSNAARRIIEVAQQYDAKGWKINGAGGEGGTITILSSTHQDRKRKMISSILQLDDSFQYIPVKLSPMGTYTWETSTG